MKRKWFLIGTAGLFAADQLLKMYAEQSLDKKEERKLAGPVVLRRVHNKGMCFGLLSDRPEIVKILSLAVSGGVAGRQAVCLFQKKGFWKKVALTLLNAGAWSNTFDRFARGYVVDYIGFSCKHPEAAKITYNLGDFFIAAGTVLLSLCSFLPFPTKNDSGTDTVYAVQTKDKEI